MQTQYYYVLIINHLLNAHIIRKVSFAPAKQCVFPQLLRRLPDAHSQTISYKDHPKPPVGLLTVTNPGTDIKTKFYLETMNRTAKCTTRKCTYRLAFEKWMQLHWETQTAEAGNPCTSLFRDRPTGFWYG